MRRMMTTKTNKRRLLLFLLVGIAAACIPQTPIPIYVTPTPQEQIAASGTPIPTVGGLAPTETAEEAATSEEPTSAGPTATFMGAIVGPDYTPPPTFTPRPTRTRPPTEEPTERPEATATSTPTPGPSPTPLPGL